MNYEEYRKRKLVCHVPTGFDIDPKELNEHLMDWQRLVVRWGVYKGRCAFFTDTGTGKTPMGLAWSDAIHKRTGKNILAYAPLAVSHQTVREGLKFGIKVTRCNSQADVHPGINITNYERMENFDHSKFGGVWLDESGRIKNESSVFRIGIIQKCQDVPFKLCTSATPSPNDYPELGNTSEFLGVASMSEMKSMYFINDSGDTTAAWRLKGHVQDNKFWEFLSEWCVMIRRPSDIGFTDDGYILPKLQMHEHIIPAENNTGWFLDMAEGLREVEDSMRETMEDRCRKIAEIVNASDEIWAVWCHRNPEGKLLSKLIKDSVEVHGTMDDDLKVKHFLDFADNKIKCLITKPKIAMYGMNWQNCHNIAVTGLSHSFEAFYQLCRRFHRFGQKYPVKVHIVIGEREGSVLETIKRKEKQMITMYGAMIKHMADLTNQELRQSVRRTTPYNPAVEMELPKFLEE